MTFGADHYVPVLKLKRGEKRALRALAARVRARVTPLFEIVEMDGNKGLAQHLKTSFDELAPSIEHFSRYFLDSREIAAEGKAGAAAAFAKASELGKTFVPVTGISRDADVEAALANRKSGIAVRLLRDEFEGGKITKGLPAWLAASKLTPQDVDLIVDLGAVDDMISDGVAALTAAFLADVPNHHQWRTLTVSACAFPRSMGGVERNSHKFEDRSEWQAWKEGLYQGRTGLRRLPSFSDCAIQHPSGVEGFDPRIMSVSASIRYALSEQWLLIKGESTDNVPAPKQFPSLASQLVYGHLSGHFATAGHCRGCEGMEGSANDMPGLGSSEKWRQLGTTHHITRAVDDLESLTWP